MSRRAFWRIIWIFAAAIVFAVVGYALFTAISTRVYTAVLIPKSGEEGFEFWETVERGAREAAREYGVELEVMGPEDEGDVDGQIRLVYEAIQKRPDMILLAPCDMEKLKRPATAVVDSGIVLVMLDCELEQKNVNQLADCVVGINNAEAARILATEMAAKLPNGGKTAILAPSPDSSSAVSRIEGIERTLSEYPDISVVEVARCGVTAEEAERTALRILEEYPDLAGMFCTNPVCSEGAARALGEREDHVFLYAFDTSPSHNEYLENGIVDGFVAQIAFNLGYLSVESGYLAWRNELSSGRRDSGYVYATRENMRDEAIQKLIYPT